VRLFHSTAHDKDDTRLFETLEAYILEHYPNPERVECLDREALRCFVETPNQLDLTDPKYLHVVKCAECTRELHDLRRIREARIQQEAESSPAFSGAGMNAVQEPRRRIVRIVLETRIFVLRMVARLKGVFH